MEMLCQPPYFFAWVYIWAKQLTGERLLGESNYGLDALIGYLLKALVVAQLPLGLTTVLAVQQLQRDQIELPRRSLRVPLGEPTASAW